MARYFIRGPHGAEEYVEVPGPGLDQRTFDARVKRGEFTILKGPGDSPPEAPDEPGEDMKRPSAAADKATWIKWAVSQGADPDKAEAMTKADLQKKF